MRVQEKIRLKRAQIKYIRRYNIRQKALKVILCVLLIAFAIDTITTVLSAKKVVSISVHPLVEASGTDTTLSGEHIAETDTPDSIETKIMDVFGDEWEIAYAIMMAESSGNPNVIGDRHLKKPSVGLFQINQIWHPYSTEDLQNPEFNIEIAKEIRDNGGWERWTTYRTGAYQKYL